MDDVVIQTLYEMLIDRGFEKNTFTWEESRLSADKGNERIYVHLLLTGKIGVKHMNDIKDSAHDDKIKRLIIIYKQNITSFAKHVIDEMVTSGIEIQLFKDSELYFNITKHVLVPKHTLLSPEEKQQFISRFNVTDSHIPHIKRTDPVSKYMGLRTGDVVEIIRESEISETSIYYRICL